MTQHRVFSVSPKSFLMVAMMQLDHPSVCPIMGLSHIEVRELCQFIFLSRKINSNWSVKTSIQVCWPLQRTELNLPVIKRV